MKFEKRKGLDDATLTVIENLVGFRLPADYRSFLRFSDGGSFVGGYPEVDADIIGKICCDSFFGMTMPRSLNLGFWHNEMKGDIPNGSLLIGKDPSGGFLLLCCAGESSGVFYYDHSYSFPTSSDAQNTYHIAGNFRQMAELVGIDLS